eukprot:508933_1
MSHSPSSSTMQLIAWICLISMAFIIFIIQVYSIYRFISLLDLLIIKKRYPILVMIEAASVIIWLLLTPLHFNVGLNAFDIPSIQFDVIAWCLQAVFGQFIVCTEVTRLWLVSYNLHYLNSSQNEQWKSHIDQDFIDKDWYLTHRNTYGNRKYIITRALCYYIFVFSIIVTTYFINFTIGTFIDAFFFFIHVCAVVHIYYKCRKYKQLKDKLLFYYEFRATAFLWSIDVFLGLLFLCFRMIGLHTVSVIGNILVFLFGLTAPSLLSTFWIPRKILASQTWNEVAENMIPVQEINVNDNCEETKEQSVEIRLYDVFKNEEKFELFVQYMYREFSEECVLCCIEYVQFKQYMVHCQMKNSMDDSGYKYINLFYNNIPKSSIVFGKNVYVFNVDRCTEIAEVLYQKYINYDSEFEVNIAANLRRKYVRLAGKNWNIEIDEFINVFDALINEMFLFMRNSYIRYEQ